MAGKRKRGNNEGGITKRYNRDGKLIGYQVRIQLPDGKRKTLGTAHHLGRSGQDWRNVDKSTSQPAACLPVPDKRSRTSSMPGSSSRRRRSDIRR